MFIHRCDTQLLAVAKQWGNLADRYKNVRIEIVREIVTYLLTPNINRLSSFVFYR